MPAEYPDEEPLTPEQEEILLEYNSELVAINYRESLFARQLDAVDLRREELTVELNALQARKDGILLAAGIKPPEVKAPDPKPAVDSEPEHFYFDEQLSYDGLPYDDGLNRSDL